MHEKAEEHSTLLETNSKSLKRIKPVSVKIAPYFSLRWILRLFSLNLYLTCGDQSIAFLFWLYNRNTVYREKAALPKIKILTDFVDQSVIFL